MSLIYNFFGKQLRGGLLLSSVLLILSFLISNKVRAQNFETDKKILGESLLGLYSVKDSNLYIDDFFDKNAQILNCNKKVDFFLGVETVWYNQIRNRRLNNYFFADSLCDYFNEILPVDFDEQILKKQRSQYDIIYLLLKNIIGDTASIYNFINSRLNEKTEIKTLIFTNSFFKEYFKNIFPSKFSENERSFRTNYSDIYSKDAYEELLTTSKWDKGEAAAYSAEILMVLYKLEYIKMNSANDFIKSFNQAGNLFKKAMYLDIAISKKIPLDSAIGTILQSSLENNFKIFAIDQTLKRTQQASVNDSCNKALKEFCSKIKYPVIAPKTIFEFNAASNFFTYSALVAYSCATRTTFSDSCLHQLQSKSRYNWSLFTEIINNNITDYDGFVKRHIKTLTSIPIDFFKDRKKIKNETLIFVYPTEREYLSYLPQNFVGGSSRNLATDGVDSLFEKLFITPEYLEYIKNSFIDESVSKAKTERLDKISVIHILNDSSANFLERGYAFYYMLTEQPKFIPVVMEKVTAIKTRSGLFKMASLFNKTDKLNYLSKEFDGTLKIINAKIDKMGNGEDLSYITNALEYFKGRETKMFYKTIKQFLSDTTNSYKLSSIILNQYPQFFYDDKVINNSKRIWYLDGLNKFYKIHAWENIIPILNPEDKNFVKNLFYQRRY